MDTVIEKDNLLHYAVKHNSKEFIKDLLNQNISVNINELDNNKQNALHIAVLNAREEIVSLLIENGIDINQKEKSLGMTPLHLAIKIKHLKIAKLLLKKCAKLNIANKQNSSALHFALEEQNKDMINLFLDHGANIDIKKFGRTPLHNAVERGQINMVKLLLEKRSNINELSMDGQTALHIAIERKNVEMVKLLLENKARIDLQKFCKYPLELAIQLECPEILRLLLNATFTIMLENEHKEKSIRDALHLAFLKKSKNLVKIFLEYNLNTDLKLINKGPLHFAAMYGWEDILREFIIKGFDVNSLGSDNESALMIASKNKYLNIVEILVENGAELNIQLQRSGQTALHFAVENCFMAELRYLLEKGANPNIASNLSVTPLHMAFDACNLEMVKILMDYEADANSPKCGKNSMEIAVEHRWHEIVKRMLKKGASPDISNRNGKCVLAIAIKNHDLEMIKILVDAGANINYIEQGSEMSTLQWALAGNFDEASLLLMELGADLDYATSSGLTALHLALERQGQEMTLQLLQRGVSLDIKQRSMLPLHVAVNRLWFEVAEILLSRGVDVNALTLYSATPLFFAVKACDLRMARLLIENGAKVDYKWDSESLLQLAACSKCPAMVELLLDHGPTIKKSDKTEALYMALRSWDDESACLLIERGADPGSNKHKMDRTPLHVAAEYNCFEAANLMMDRGVPVDVQDSMKVTPLQLAAKSNRLEMLELLIARGAKVNSRSRGEYYTSMHFAVLNDNCDVATRLLEAGALTCIAPPEPGEPDEQLLEAAPAVQAERERQRTALELAVKHGKSRRLIELMLKRDVSQELGAEPERRQLFIRLVKLSTWTLLTELLVKHLAKFDDGIQYDFFQKTSASKLVHIYYEKCVLELARMKEHYVYDAINLHYLFVKQGFKRIYIVRKQVLLDALENSDLEAQYPIYFRMITDHLNEAKATKLVHSKAQRALELTFQYQLPALAIQRILDYMTKEEMAQILISPEKKD